MPQKVEPTSVGGEPEAQREIVRLALDDIAAEVCIALRDARLDFSGLSDGPQFWSRHRDYALSSPSDKDWFHVSAIVCRIIGQRLGDARLRGRALHCAVANATTGVAEVTADERPEA
jgi:hypothetical protein